MSCVIVYDSDHPGAKNNICFTDEYALAGPGHSFTVDLARACRKEGVRVMTSDVFLNEGNRSEELVLLITDMVSRNTDTLISRGAVPFLCMSTESPLIARKFYIDIKALAGRFVYNMQFRGTAQRLVGTGTIFSPMHYPVDSREQIPQAAWSDRRFLVLINRNKRAFFHDHSTLKNSLRSVASRMLVQVQKLRDPWIRSKEIYKDRIEAIFHFSRNSGFELYGMGWDQPIPGFGVEYSKAALRAYKGPLGPGDKLKTMSNFKFAICFENCAFPGYVTEKIFDCFLAGCIPVYFGAPDISDFVPPNSYIDFREFSNMNALEHRLSTMTEPEGRKMIEAGRDFLLSKQFDPHDQKLIINEIVRKALLYPKTEVFSYELS